MGLRAFFPAISRRLWAEAALFHLKRAGVAVQRGEFGKVRGAPVFYLGTRASFGGYETTGVGVHPEYATALESSIVELVERVSLAAPESVPANVAGRSFVSGESAEIPAQAVFWNYRPGQHGEHQFLEPSVHGSGCARAAMQAVLFGIYEWIERDAFLLHWLKKITPPRIDPRSIPDEEIRFSIAEAEKRGLAVHILDITSDVTVPSYFVALVGERAPRVSRGSSANLNPLLALKKAFSEAWGNYALNLHLASNASSVKNEAGDRAILERYRTWVRPESFRHFGFMLKGNPIPFENRTVPDDEAGALRALFREKGIDAHYHISRHPILERLGLSAAKTFMPGLIPFYFSEENAHFAHLHPRLAGGALNRFPHPFA